MPDPSPDKPSSSLTPCPECGHRVWPNTTRCPQCGYRFRLTETTYRLEQSGKRLGQLIGWIRRVFWDSPIRVLTQGLKDAVRGAKEDALILLFLAVAFAVFGLIYVSGR